MDLAERARAWGVEPGYHDYQGNWRQAPDETLVRILEALGAEGDGPPTAGAVVRRAGHAHALPGAVEVMLEDGGSERIDGEAPAHLPIGYHEVVNEDGSRRRFILGPGRCYLPGELKTWGWGVQLYALRSARSWGMGDLRDLEDLAAWAAGRRAGDCS